MSCCRINVALVVPYLLSAWIVSSPTSLFAQGGVQLNNPVFNSPNGQVVPLQGNPAVGPIGVQPQARPTAPLNQPVPIPNGQLHMAQPQTGPAISPQFGQPTTPHGNFAPATGSLFSGQTPTSNSGGEVIRERYENGAVRIEREVVQDENKNYVNHGSWRHFLPNGRVSAQAYFHYGKKSGDWTRWLMPKDAPVLATGSYQTFQAPFLSSFHYDNNQLNGVWRLSDSQKRTVFEINFVNGKRHAAATWYFNNGRKEHEFTYVDGSLHGAFQRWSPQGQLIDRRLFQEGHEIGKLTEHHRPEVKKLEFEILAGKVEMTEPDDPWEIKFAVEKKTGEDIKHGTVTAWFPNGQLKFSGRYQQNVQDGEFVWYYANGQRQAQGQIEKNKRKGSWSWWHENGMRASTGEYIAGKPIGEWRWWQSTGQLAKTKSFANGGIDAGNDQMQNASFQNK